VNSGKCANCGFPIEAHGNIDDECPIFNGCVKIGWMTSTFRDQPEEILNLPPIEPAIKSRECLCGIMRVDCTYHK
jgi:hypothetical protein